MIRAKKVSFQTSKENIDRLFACNRESALVWNHCLALSRQSYQDQGKWITKSELQKATKGKYHLHSQSIQAVCHKYLFARNAAHQSIQKGRKTGRYPYKNKLHYPTKWAKDGFRIHKNGKIELSMESMIESERNQLSYLPETYQRGESKKSNFAMIMVSTYRLPLKMEKRMPLIRRNNLLE